MSIETSSTIIGDSSALARLRRKAKLSRKNENDKRFREEDEPEEVVSEEQKKPHITGIKRQARYDPGVKLTRDELTAWRKEARRVRNRESAAESRRRTRNKIDELEDKLSALTEKYEKALKRIAELENNDSVTPLTISQEESCKVEEPVVSPISSPELTSLVSPVSSPRPSFRLDSDSHEEQVEQKYQHIMTMISRPTAVKTPSGVGTPYAPPASPPSVSDESNNEEAIDDEEIGDFLMDALQDLHPNLTDDVEHDAFLESLCSV